MIKLYGFGPAFGLPDSSPFVTKVNSHLRLGNIEFESCNGPQYLRKAPKAKLPFIEDDGELIADSVFIVEHLQKKYDADVDKWLNPEQKAIAQLVSKSIEENLYWSVVNSRWINDDTWPKIKQEFFAPLPFPLNHLIARLARNSTRKQLAGHGIGKHSQKEILGITQRSLDSLSAMLGDKKHFFGDQISSLDISVFSVVGALCLADLDNETNQLARSYDNLRALAQRMKSDIYPEL